ncbi:DUF935 domain-containing protein [Azonexus sp.]|uniref:DUF935 domain-containing protein n=1 Tax=Azonexus sp. TaxID=1872668 RepID=UPI0039E6B4B3
MKIVDANGQPFDSSALRETQTSKVAYLHHQLIDSQLDGLTPARAARILREADQGDLSAQAQLFDDMLDRDAHLRAEFDKRRSAPLGLDWSIVPPANATPAEQAAAEFAEEMLRDVVDDLEDVLQALQDAPGYGYGAVEIAWERWGKDWIPAFHPRPQTWFSTDVTRRELRLADGTAEGAPLQSFGWIMHQPGKVKTGYLGRAGLLRACLWPFVYKSYAIGDFAEFLETYGLPIILGKYMAGASPEEKASLLRAVASLGHDARAIMPQGMELEIQSVTGAGAGVSQHLAMVDWADRAQSKAVLGQTVSAEARSTGMGSGVADLHDKVRRDILRSDARQLAGTLTRDLIYPLIVLNRPGVDGYRRCPRFVFDLDEAEDLGRYAEALPKLVGVGMTIPAAWAHEKLRIPQPTGDEAVLAAPAVLPAAALKAATPAVALAALGANKEAVGAPLDRQLAQLAPLADAEVAAMLTTVRRMLDAAESLEEFSAMLDAAWPALGGAGLADTLADALFASELLGRAEVVNGR